jgi:hypothetical protein
MEDRGMNVSDTPPGGEALIDELADLAIGRDVK